jgi:hypothetical protein
LDELALDEVALEEPVIDDGIGAIGLAIDDGDPGDCRSAVTGFFALHPQNATASAAINPGRSLVFIVIYLPICLFFCHLPTSLPEFSARIRNPTIPFWTGQRLIGLAEVTSGRGLKAARAQKISVRAERCENTVLLDT